MTEKRTVEALAKITDEGLFEQLATAILRESNSIYEALVHSGVNVSGMTVKSPLDGICFVQGANPPHMIAFHHTITARKDLEKKWLYEPGKAKKRRKISGSKTPAGDLIKTAEVAADERKRTPDLRVTLVLTTNEEPSETLVRSLSAAALSREIEIDLWSRSRLSHFLDNKPSGQWIRRTFLHIEQEILSTELFHELSKRSLETYCPPDDPTAWVPRTLDDALAVLRPSVTFLVAGSGLGKSVACYRRLQKHIESGGLGIFLPHETLISAATLEQAVLAALHQHHQSLTAMGSSVLSYCTPEKPLLLVVEDINRSGQAQLLVEKLAGWSRAAKDSNASVENWRLLCPVWPEIISSMGDEARKRIEPLTITGGAFSPKEARDAVLGRARIAGRNLSALHAEEISSTLGDDPLLIALHNLSDAPDPHRVINLFIEGSISRAALAAEEHAAAEFRGALRALAAEILFKRQTELFWRDVGSWERLQGGSLQLISRLAHRGDLIRFTGPSTEQSLAFRHDRVRDCLLVDAAAELDRGELLAEDIIEDPYYAEVMGSVLVWDKPKSDFLERLASSNPLALFHALRLCGRAGSPPDGAICDSINKWLDDPATHDPSKCHLRWEALAILAETDSASVPAIVRKFQDRTRSGELARLRNGEVMGGIELCMSLEPGTGAPWRDIQIEHAKVRHGHQFVNTLGKLLRQAKLDEAVIIGALRLAGHLADSSLAEAIEACWNGDDNRCDHLADYLWAFGQCCADDPERFLRPVCDAWAALPDKSEDEKWPSPRDSLAADQVRWAFRRWPPVHAIDYFTDRGSHESLRWPITLMLHGMDHPKAVLFVLQEIVAIRQRLAGTNSFSPFAVSATEDWRRAQEDGRPMSKSCRDLLLALWRDETNDKYTRLEAFRFWAVTQQADDIEVLRAAQPSDELAAHILGARLRRGDQLAIPAMIEKVRTTEEGYWWQYGRHVWSPELTKALDEFLLRRSVRSKGEWGEAFEADWFTHEMIMRLPERDAEGILLKHWRGLRFGAHFIQTALYVSTPDLLSAVESAVKECPEPAKLMVHVGQHFGIRTSGHPGLTRESQVRALAPYLHLLSPLDVAQLWGVCNDHGWFKMRQELFDALLQPSYMERMWNKDRVISQLDKMVTERLFVSIDFWIDGYLKAGVSWGEIVTMMMTWLEERRSREVLEVVARAIAYRGTRGDLVALKAYDSMPQPMARQLIEDTQFAVRRRSIC